MTVNTVDMQAQSTIATIQISEEDRREIWRLREKYGVNILAQALFEEDISSGWSSVMFEIGSY